MKLEINGPFIKLYPQNFQDRRALLLHGYGQTRYDLLPIAARLCQAGWECSLPDLPGHGDHAEILSAQTARGFISTLLDQAGESDPSRWDVIGYSLGARLAMTLDARKVIAVSPPFSTEFKGPARAEILRFVKPRRVRELRPMAGLTEILNSLEPSTEWPKAHSRFYANKDLDAVLSAVDRSARHHHDHEIQDCDHASILSAPQLILEILEVLS